MASRGKFGKAALLMGAAAVAAGVLLKRDKVQALLNPGGSDAKESSWAPAQPPEPSNYDAPGPPANTATPVPAPDAQILEEDGSIDEAAEEAAAAAEAANIGGQVSDYAGIVDPDEPATEAERPLVESGEGSSEGEEQAEAELAEAAAPSDGMSDFERQIDDAIEEQSQPFSGETLEPVSLVEDPPGDAEMRAAETAAAADMAEAETETVEAPAPEPTPEPEPVAYEPEPAPEPEMPPAPAEVPTQAYSVPPAGGVGAPEVTEEIPAAPEPSSEPAPEEPDAYATYITPAVSPPAADPEPEPEAEEPSEPAGEVPFGEGTTAEPPTTPGTPPTASWQPPAPPEPTPQAPPAEPPAAPPEDAAAPTEEQPQLPTDEKDDEDGNDWRTWSGNAINP